MSLEFNLISSENYCTYITDGTHGTHSNQETGKYLLSAKDILDGNVHIKDNSRIISEDDFNKIHKNYKLENYDVLLTVAGTIGRTAIIKNYQNNYTFQRSVAIFKTNDKIKSLWLYYYLNSPIGKQIIKSLSKGTTQLILPLKDLRSLKIPVPKNISDQKKILSILTDIDKKIEINKRINKNLEKLLMAIFTSWFINFENYDKSNGMKNDDSYGEVPKSWSVEMLEDYVDFVTGVEPGSKNYHEKPEDNDIPFLRVGDLGSKDNAIFINPSLSKNKILEYDDIVLSLDATIGIVKMGLEGAYSTGMRKLVIKNDNINKPFLYCLVKSERIQRIIETFATGTTILHAGKSIKHMNFALSDKQTMDKFGEIGNPIISTILANLKEIEKLTNMRDTLLPKLMSGEIDVSKINLRFDFNDDWQDHTFKELLIEVNEKTTVNNQHEILSSTKEGIFTQKEYFANRNVASKDNTGYKILRKNQIVLSPQNLWMGNINVNTEFEIGIVSPSYKIYETTDLIEIDYFKHIIKLPRLIYEYKCASEQGASIVRRNLNKQLFDEITISIPSLKEQQKIGNMLTLIDKKITETSKQIDESKEFKKGLLQQMFV